MSIMKQMINIFMSYLSDVKQASANTVVSYRRDLLQLSDYLEEQGITKLEKVTHTTLNSYVLYLEKQGKATTTISRVLASVKSFFHYAFYEGYIKHDPAENLKAPKIEKKTPLVLSQEEVHRLLSQPDGDSPKEIRDKAMMELLYGTGIRVSELIALQVQDLNLGVGFITCRDGQKTRVIPFQNALKIYLNRYMDEAREILCHGNDQTLLFTNCSGNAMSRQGFWKIIKHYAEASGISAEITPHTLRHSFAAHLVGTGVDIHAVQAIMGHSDMSSTQIYNNMLSAAQQH